MSNFGNIVGRKEFDISNRSLDLKELIGQVRFRVSSLVWAVLSPEKFKIGAKFKFGRGFWPVAPKGLVLQKIYDATKVAVCSKL